MSNYQRPTTAGNTAIILVGVAVLLVCGIGAVAFVATRKPEAAHEKNEPVETAKTAPIPKTPAQKEPNRPAPKPVSVPPKVDEHAWRDEAKAEYLEALKAQERRASATATAVGSLGKGERLHAMNCLKVIDERGIDKVPESMIEDAAKIAPQYIAAERREQMMRTGAYAKLVADGKRPERHPVEKRKQLYGEFARTLGIEKKWALVLPFDDLSAAEMDDAVAVAAKASSAGLSKLTKRERALLLKAEALDYFKRELGL